jgi:hypothetical protein
MLLGLKYGIDSVQVALFYGSDFFLDNETELMDMLNKAPNAILRKNIIDRMGKTKYRFNKELMERQALLNALLPFATDKDFSIAITNNLADDAIKKLQLRFDYWISTFEADYGDIVIFYQNVDGTNSEKLAVIRNLLSAMVKKMSPEVKVDVIEKTE